MTPQRRMHFATRVSSHLFRLGVHRVAAGAVEVSGRTDISERDWIPSRLNGTVCALRIFVTASSKRAVQILIHLRIGQ